MTDDQLLTLFHREHKRAMDDKSLLTVSDSLASALRAVVAQANPPEADALDAAPRPNSQEK